MAPGDQVRHPNGVGIVVAITKGWVTVFTGTRSDLSRIEERFRPSHLTVITQAPR